MNSFKGPFENESSLENYVCDCFNYFSLYKVVVYLKGLLLYLTKGIVELTILQIAVTISNISCLVIYPSPSRSYMVKAHFNFCSNLPLEVTLRAHKNSRKSILPSPLASNVLNTCSANFDASPYGKKFPQIFLNSSTDS